MGPSRPISLFAEPPKTHQRPFAFFISAIVHTVLVGVVLYGFLFAPRINMKEAADRYTLRRVDLNDPNPERRRAGDDAYYPGEKAIAQNDAAHNLPAPAASSFRQIPKLHLADRTIVQPDVPDNQIVLKHMPLPSLMLWSAQKQNVKLLAPPPVPKMANVNMKPTLTRPTPQATISDAPFSSTQFTTKMPMPVPASSTPVMVRGPDLAQRIPQTPSNITTESGSGAVMSISELQIVQGTVSVPPVNQTAAGKETGAMGKGPSGDSAQGGAGKSNTAGGQQGNQQSQGAAGNKPGSSGNPHGNAGNGGNAGTNTAKAGAGSNGAGGTGNEPSFTRISLPPNGQYGVVVVGSTMTDEYPESAALWGGRLTYSVYLKVGLARNWILQYSLPPDADPPPPGQQNHLDAPWPFYIVRPNESLQNVNADALMVHGFITDAGRFEQTEVVFPPRFRHAQLLVAALQQWKFRPAKHNGSPARVEVLLIIPEDEQ